MTLNWTAFVPAVALLWFPALPDRQVQREPDDPQRSPPVSLVGMMGRLSNWADLLRSSLGVWLLMAWSFGFDLAQRSDVYAVFLIRASVLTIGLLLQTVRLRSQRPTYFLAPVFYLSGLTMFLTSEHQLPIPSLHGAFAVLVGWSFSLAERNARFLLPAMGVALAIGGFIIGGFGLYLLLNVVAILLPPFIALLFLTRLRFLGGVTPPQQ